jgi:hypothetical protein
MVNGVGFAHLHLRFVELPVLCSVWLILACQIPLETSVLCDESGHTKFPFSYLAHVMMLTPTQIRLRICSGLLIFAHHNCHFRQAVPEYAEWLQL